jgi:TRAP-type mannitol/chloroaromatic compound transport system permease small subunit
LNVTGKASTYFFDKGNPMLLKLIDGLSVWMAKVFSYLAVIMILAIVYEVGSRYLFNAPTIWANEAVTYLCGIFAVMGGAYTLQQNGHVKVDIVYNRLPGYLKTVVDVLAFPAFLICFGVLIWVSFDVFLDSLSDRETTGTAWLVPIYPVRAFIPIAGLLILLQGTANFIRSITERKQ